MTHVQFRTLIVCAALALVACMPKPDATTPAPMPPEADCDAAAYRDLIGQHADAAIIIPDPKRVIPPNAAVTMDYNPERTNVSLNKQGKITSIRCG